MGYGPYGIPQEKKMWKMTDTCLKEEKRKSKRLNEKVWDIFLRTIITPLPQKKDNVPPPLTPRETFWSPNVAEKDNGKWLHTKYLLDTCLEY